MFVLAALSAFAQAGRVWVSTPIEIDGEPIRSESCALAMRSDGTWPVIAYNDRGDFRVASLTAAGWVQGPTAGRAEPRPGGISTATSSDGKICFAFSNGSALMLDSSGFSMLPNYVDEPLHYYPYSGPSVAFDGRGMPSILHNQGEPGESLAVARYTGSGWYNDTVGYPDELYHSRSFGLAYDSYGQANVAFGEPEMMFAMKGVLTNNQWEAARMFEMPFHAEQIDMVVGTGDVPWVFYSFPEYLSYATYDRQLQQWVNGTIASVEVKSGFDVACDSGGGIGLAFVDREGMLGFAYNDGVGGWELNMGIARAEIGPYTNVSLAFDREDNPVICYMDEFHNSLCLAYDPITVPEPGTVVILSLGGLLFNRRKK